MKRKFFFIPVLLSALFLFSCSKSDKIATKTSDTKDVTSSETTNDGKPSFEKISVVKSYNDCVPESENCTYFSVKYDILKSGSNMDKINRAIQDTLARSATFFEEDPSTSLETSMNNFIKEYESFKTENPDAVSMNWYIEIFGEPSYTNSQLLSYSIANSSFTGGAHPNSYNQYINFDLSTGNTLKVSDVLNPGFEKDLNKILEQKFRKEFNVKPGESLAEGGLFENKIEYNGNFTFDKEGMVFYYNPYEIGPYAMGAIVLTVPYSEIKSYLNPKWKLG